MKRIKSEAISTFCWRLHDARIQLGDEVLLIKDRSKKGTVLHMGPAHTIAKVQWNGKPLVTKAEFVSHLNKV